ncbi:PREDICTED: anaphase-promoting complex subunit 11 isoform X1 [Cercocebus atys]|uniref:anaphase-promoting complex subunit 11 isoform X1 n=1 Tax=Cercocebus atys TaxID=9531 RepID=UPI0005F3D94A|nr:PREDICTED: anaphase-promoting complex subunit 11 isoform X1 [Cercocebus atys]XP_011921496.1 PREDICTED: anaphase-promoting complex subunit 11 isoform X1 [Cercocebus atys]XP_011921497.1 PREDICTED: anaphase-promoting complex subunit 11 isoform X1 [Cercocebus atys]XP_011921498.1 PREDICTED: anaphase-promoting complex subunit 11 isoform X1 [Cercocebus atys]XP_011921499.1 PREDICTED: anaphase-promoting complex subunit 11 isoform X1 [Cercocebus atys]XP_011921501.1 PREDICTED: anaphase-promoting compl
MKVKIKCWNGVATWLWVANDENCGICRMAFNGCCPDCECPSMLSELPRLQGAWRRLPAGVGPVLPLLPHALHPQVAARAAGAAALPHVSPGMEVQGVRPGLALAGGGVPRPLPHAGADGCGSCCWGQRPWAVTRWKQGLELRLFSHHYVDTFIQ